MRSVIAQAFALALVLIAPAAASAADRVPLDYKAYDGWKTITSPVLSDDGTWFAYALTPQDGDATLVAREIASGRDVRAPRGSAPRFAAGAKFVVATWVASKSDRDAARKAKKKDDELPKNGLLLLDLASGATTTVERIKTIAVSKNGGPVIAYRAEPAPSATPAASPSPSPSAAPNSPRPSSSASPTAAPLPTPSPTATPGNKKKDAGTLLTIRDLSDGTQVAIPDVSEVAIDDADTAVAYTTQTTTGANDGVHVRLNNSGTIRDIMTGAGRYRNVSLSRDGATLFFLTDRDSYASDAPHYTAYAVDLRAAVPQARPIADAGGGFAPNENGAARFSKDGKRVFFGVAAVPTPVPSNTPEPMHVDLWSATDLDLQSTQKKRADAERNRTYTAMVDLETNRYAQIGTPQFRRVTTNENAAYALVEDDLVYRRAASWVGDEYTDAYTVSLADGARRLAIRHAIDPKLSPGGRFVLAWDAAIRHWVTIRSSDGKRTILGALAPVNFWDTTDDHPAPPRPFGDGGWIADDAGVFIYDRYDIWLANPETGDARLVTAGAGRKTSTIYSTINLDPDEGPFALDNPITLSLLDEHSFASGYARIDARANDEPEVLLRLPKAINERLNLGDALHLRVSAPLKARRAERVAFFEETFNEFRDYWTSPSALFATPVKVTDANPQQANYRWGSERLVSWKSSDGRPLRGLLYLPDGVDRTKPAPMLVYFYEKYSDQLHIYRTPAPGTSPNFARYVSNGYAVFLPDVSYSDGHPGLSALHSIMPGIDEVIKTGLVDPAHIGIAGHSWAAYQINYMITQTHRFRAAEAGAAVTDMISAYGGIRLESGNVRESQYEHGQSRIGATPWDRPDLYIENSGLFHIKDITTPYLTIHNDADGAVPWQQGIEFLTAMRRLGKPAWMFTFNDEDHNLRGREQQKYWTVHLDEWFDYWLKGMPRPTWMMGIDYLHRGERDVRPLYGEDSH